MSQTVYGAHRTNTRRLRGTRKNPCAHPPYLRTASRPIVVALRTAPEPNHPVTAFLISQKHLAGVAPFQNLGGRIPVSRGMGKEKEVTLNPEGPGSGTTSLMCPFI